LIDFFGEILKIVKFNCDPVLRQVMAIAQATSELRHFLSGPVEERASLVGETIANYDPRSMAFARRERGIVSGNAEARVTLSKLCLFKSHVLFDCDGFDPSELF
jgi:hypothetical protein